MLASLLALSLACQSPVDAPQDPGSSYHFRIPAPIAPAVRLAIERRFGCECTTASHEGPMDVIVQPEERDAFLRLAPSTVVLVDRGRPFHEIVGAQPGAPDAGYFTVAEIDTEMATLAAAYPALAKVVDLSTLPGAALTHQGRAIKALKVSDNVASDEPEPGVIVAAQHHARELNSTFMVIGAMRRILQTYATDPAMRQLADGHEIYFVPCVNPDGTEHVWNVDVNWRKNRRANGGTSYGVDNNRNYPFMWSSACGGSTTTTSDTYRGPSAGSEPETKTMMALHQMLRPVKYFDFHSSGRQVLITYNSCATINPTTRTFIDRYVAALATPMAFTSRFPSASGEAPEWHWAESGTLSFLIEIMTSFQPPFVDVVTEEATRVWPGLRAGLTTWQPALRGRVRSIFAEQPVEATISYTPNLFSHAEKLGSRARDGLYHVWLPLGTHQVTFSAPGFRPFTKAVTVSSYDQAQDLDVCLIPTWIDPTLGKSGTDRLGTITSLTYASPGDAGAGYLVGIALGANPGTPVGCGRTLPLNADPLLVASLQPGSPIINGIGVLPGAEQITAQLFIPPIPALVGITVYAGGITTADGYPYSVKKFSTSLPITFQQ